MHIAIYVYRQMYIPSYYIYIYSYVFVCIYVERERELAPDICFDVRFFPLVIACVHLAFIGFSIHNPKP